MGQIDLQSLRVAGACASGQPTLTVGSCISLRKGRIHEVTGAGADLFAIMAAAKHSQNTLWIALHRDLVSLCPTGLQAYIDIQDLILVEAVSRGELLWAADQALRADGGFCVILDMPDQLSLKESRRLQLAAEQGGGLGLILLRGGVATSAAQTRWDCAPIHADHPTWDWRCTKGKNGEAGAWRVTQTKEQQRGQNAEDTLHMAPAAPA